jgi:hypothetical protein
LRHHRTDLAEHCNNSLLRILLRACAHVW